MEVYKITNLVNNKCYIGITGKTFRKRYNHRDDWWNAPKVNKLVKNAVNKYGSENFRVEILCEARSRDDLNYLEVYFIDQFKSMAPNGYNLTSGGDTYNKTEETKLKISLAKKGTPAWNKGKKLSESHRENFTKSLRKSYTSGKITAWNKGISTGPMSKEAIENSARGHFKKVACFDSNGIFIKEYESMKATELDGYDSAGVSLCCKGKIKTHRNLIWKRV